MARIAKKQEKLAAIAAQLQELFAEELDDQPDSVKTFDDLETVSVAVGDELSRMLLEASTRRHKHQAQVAKCPDCGKECSCIDQEPRVLQARRGEVTWQEPNFHCNRCRRSFFPGESQIGVNDSCDSQSRR